MRPTMLVPAVLPAAAGLGTAVVGLLTVLPAPAGPAAAGLLLCWTAFTLWPWAVLPVAIIGGMVAGVGLGTGDVRSVVLAHVLVLTAGCLALLTRRYLGADRHPPPVRPGWGMPVLAVGIVAAAGYGLAVGNDPGRVLTAAYQLAIVPAHFLIALHTLRTKRRLYAAGLLYLGMTVMVTVPSLAVAGRHGGIVAFLAIAPLLVLASRGSGRYRVGALVVAGLLGIDVVLASFRGIWLATATALLILVVRGTAAIRRALAATVSVAVLLAVVLALLPGIRERAAEVGRGLENSAGYRGSEAAVGLDVFARSPLIGAGLGQSTPDRYLPGFAVTDVGPVYHAFYVTILANVGLLGLGLLLWPVLRAIRVGLARRDGTALAFAATACGCLVASGFSAPTDGHWELGLLPALALLAARFSDTAAPPDGHRLGIGRLGPGRIRDPQPEHAAPPAPRTGVHRPRQLEVPR